MKKFLYIFVIVLLAFNFPVENLLAQSDSELTQRIEATKRERDALLEEQKKLQATLNTLNQESQTLTGTVKSLDATRSKIANDLKITQSNINASNLTIQKLTNDISANETTIDAHRLAITDSLKKLRTYDSYSMIYALLAYDTLDEVWSDTTSIMNLQDKLGSEIKLLEKTQENLLKNKTAREVKKVELVSLSSQLKGQKEVADETRAAQAKLLADTKQKEAEYQKMLAENKAREEEFEKLLFQFESQLTASDRSTLPSAKKGVLSWPVENVYITQQFGKTSSSGRLYASGTHNGTDFRASVGTKILSVRGGVVKGTGNTDEQKGCYSYGRWILIEHDNGLTSLYSHLSGTIVSTGQVVGTGQVIGYSGGQPRQFGSGFSTGPHLHLAIFASSGVRIAKYSNSLNCQNVSIPLANPQDYLDPIAYLPRL